MKARKAPRQGGRGKPAADGPVFLFPGPEGWESWSQTADGGLQCVGPSETPRKLRPPPQAVMCLPSRSFFSMPVWVREAEGPPDRAQVGLRLEEKGLLGPSPETAVWGMEAIRSEALPGPDGQPESRQLEATVVLAPGFQEEWLVETAGRHEVAGRTLAAPRGGSVAVLRRELGRWVADFYVQGKWLHTQPLLARELDAGAAVELAALLSQWEGEGVLAGLTQVVVRDEGENPVGDDFLAAWSCPCQVEPRMPPRLPAAPWNLEPPALVEHRQEQVASQRRKKFQRIGLLVYGLLMSAAAAWILSTWVRIQMVSRELGEVAGPAGRIESTAMVWREAAALVDPASNALEVLWQVSRPMVTPEPPMMEGVQLTVFDLNSKRLVLQGKAADVVKVQAYVDWLKNNAALARFTWNSGQPRLAPDGTATFSVEGTIPQAGAAEGEGNEEVPIDESPAG